MRKEEREFLKLYEEISRNKELSRLREENEKLRSIGIKLLTHLVETDFDVCGTPDSLLDEAKNILNYLP